MLKKTKSKFLSLDDYRKFVTSRITWERPRRRRNSLKSGNSQVRKLRGKFNKWKDEKSTTGMKLKRFILWYDGINVKKLRKNETHSVKYGSNKHACNENSPLKKKIHSPLSIFFSISILPVKNKFGCPFNFVKKMFNCTIIWWGNQSKICQMKGWNEKI